jgi:two-component system chemotaxis response regulator CheY
MKLLLVDDSATMRRILVNALKSLGFTDLVEAGDGKEALEKLTPDVGMVITDWNMPVMGGLDFVRAVRATAALAEIPVLMVTTRSAESDILEAASAGVSGYILKPFTPPVLKEKIDQLLAAAS